MAFIGGDGGGDHNNLMEFLKSKEFSNILIGSIKEELDKIIRENVKAEMGVVMQKLNNLEEETKRLRYVNAKLLKKLKESSEVDDSEVSSMLDDFHIGGESDDEENDEKNKGERIQGTVRWFNAKSGFGFIVLESGEEVFVHQSAIKKRNPNKCGRSLQDGEIVEFTLKETRKGKEALQVTGPNGAPVLGSTYDPERKEGIPLHKTRTFSRHSSMQSIDHNLGENSGSRPSSRQRGRFDDRGHHNNYRNKGNRGGSVVGGTDIRASSIVPPYPEGYVYPYPYYAGAGNATGVPYYPGYRN